MKKLTAYLLLTLVWCSTSIAQETDYAIEMKVDQNTLTYKCSSSGTVFHSDFKVVANDRVLWERRYRLDVTLEHYRFLQHRNVIESARESETDLTKDDLNKIAGQVDELLTAIFSQTQLNPPLVQSLFFHKAILKVKERFLNGEGYDCLPHPGYFLGKTYFFDQRDYFYKRDMVKEVIGAHPEFNDVATQQLAEYINGLQEENISFEKFYSFFVNRDKFMLAVNNIADNQNPSGPVSQGKRNCAWWCPMGCGSDWGCCGNYSGCCWYANIICLVHDAGCSYTQCQPRWLCFPGCVPD